MMLSRYHVDATEEAEDAIFSYELIRPGLGQSFGKAVKDCLDRILAHPRLLPLLVQGQANREVRSCSLERFPYSVYYEILETEIVILAIGHHHRRPGYWRRRRS